jgi:hypothetical protein
MSPATAGKVAPATAAEALDQREVVGQVSG